ncbi:MAG: hypothetical protein PHU42_00840 [Patescibacteria group bacterium]|nr:hypothetical protein [Patescibacteria group bacterium]
MSKPITSGQDIELLTTIRDGKVTCAQMAERLKDKKAIQEFFRSGVVKTTKGRAVLLPDSVDIEPDLLARFFEAITRDEINLDDLLDPLAPYRAIDGLLVVGAAEWEKAMTGPNGENPLNLDKGWVPEVPLPEAWTPELLRKLVELCKRPEWNCIPVLQLELFGVARHKTSLVNLYNWFGVQHDGLGPGIIRPGIDYSNWFIKQGIEGWPHVPATDSERWRISYVDFPAFTTKKRWENQQKVTKEHGLINSSVTSDALMMLLLAINYRKFRTSTWARTSTIYDERPLHVIFYDSLDVYDYWHPENAHGLIGAAVEGVPLELAA